MYMHFTLDDIGSSILLAANWYFMIDIGISKGNCAEFTMG
jgi:hypothetical protein